MKLPLNLVIIVVIPLQSQLVLHKVKLEAEAVILSCEILNTVTSADMRTLYFHQTILAHSAVWRSSKITFVQVYKESTFFDMEAFI